MKYLKIYILFVTSLFISGCAHENVTSPNLNNSNGKLILKIDNTTTPQKVEEVIASLTRSGYSTMMDSLNVTDDTTGFLLMQNIPVGQWHLKINALNSSAKVLYSGESDVVINEDETTQVNLDLLPVGSGMGSISIQINWGLPRTSFTDYSNNPVFTVYQNPSSPLAVSHAKIFPENGINKIWYLCTYNGGKRNIWYAESMDGIIWTNKSSVPVLDAGRAGLWDDYCVDLGSVIKDSTLYKMYYSGARNPYGPSAVGLATSTDGKNWVKYANPVLNYSNLEYNIGVQTVLKIGNTYYMYYTSSPQSNYNNCSINLAVSIDGVNWERYSDNPILSAEASWEGVGVTYPSVIYEDNQFIMIYENSARDKYGMAKSSDGKNWTKESQNPVFTNQDTYKKWTQIDYPFLTKLNSEYRIYYSGNDGTDKLSIGFAKSDKIN